MILPLLVDNIGEQLSNVIKHTMPDVNNQNICMQIKIESETIYNSSLCVNTYSNSTDHTGRTNYSKSSPHTITATYHYGI